jgi:ubiquinone/menaquinone biosynthesis C-methylase UbiE
MMSKQTDPDYLKNEAYDDADDLKIRIDIQTRFSTHQTNWFQWLFQHLVLPDAGRILDLGSGPGDLWLNNTNQIPEHFSIVLSDLSLGMLKEAKSNIGSIKQVFSYSVLDAQSLPFPDGLFECVIGSGLLDHLNNRDKGLTEILRVLKPGGRFYTTCGSRTHLQEVQTLVEPYLGGDMDFGGDPHRFGLENGMEILSQWFTQIEVARYKDILFIEQPEPVLLYVFSEAEVRSKLTPESRQAFVSSVRQQIAQEGAIQVQVEKGLFEARKEDKPED